MRQPTRNLVLILGGAALIAVAAYYSGQLPDGRAQSLAPGGAPSGAGRVEVDSMLSTSPPDCDSMASCYRDTARVRALDDAPGRAVDARWVVFGAAGDSLELTARADSTVQSFTPGEPVGFAVTASHASAVRYDRDTRGNTASSVHVRLAHDGAVAVDASADERGLHDTVPYTLSVRRKGGGTPPPWVRPTGGAAALTLAAAQATDRFTIAPIGVTDWRVNPARWSVFAGRHKVALVADSLYVICAVPCTTPDTVHLKPWGEVTRRY